jgi:hypothetical protein
MFNWNKHRVCLAEGPRDSFVLLAIRAEFVSNSSNDGAAASGKTVIWDDGSHQRAFPVKQVIVDESALFRFEDDRGRVFALRPMTAEFYEDKVRAQVGGPDLETDDDVMEFYLAPRGW